MFSNRLHNIGYKLFRLYADFMFRHSYRHISYVGLENIPTDGAILYAPNHANGLQDALAIVSLDALPKRFASRADLFQNRRLGRFLHAVGMRPINRIRDGYASVKSDREIMEHYVDILAQGLPFCMMPEGTHRCKHSLLPLRKGLVRLAHMAVERFGDTKPVYILPVGLDYGNFFRYRSSLLINIGKPINVTKYIKERQDLTTPQLLNSLRSDLAVTMQQLFLCVPDDEMYEGTLEACYLHGVMVTNLCPKSNDLDKNNLLLNRLHQNQKVIAAVQRLREESADEAKQLCDKLTIFAKARRKAHIRVASLHTKHLTWSVIKRTIVLLICLPYFLMCAIATLPIWLTASILIHYSDDEAFYNSYRCALAMIGLPLCYVVLAVILFCYLPWLGALIVFIILLPAYNMFHDYVNYACLWWSDLNLLCRRNLRQQMYQI